MTLTALALLLALALLAVPVVRALRAGGLWWWAYRRYLLSATWQRTRRAVLYRDFYTCRQCGCGVPNGRSLQVHHLPGVYHGWLWYALAPTLGLREDPDGLETLCLACHIEEHEEG